MDIGFIFVARDCGSSLWQASFATLIFGVLLGQILLNITFAFTDCDNELPSSLGFFLLDFKLVNTAVRSILPFDPDSSHLPVGRPVTLRTIRQMICMEKVLSDIAQASIQIVFLQSANVAKSFVVLSVLVGIIHGTLSIVLVVRDYVQDEWDVQARRAELGTALLPCDSIRRLDITSVPRSFDHGQLPSTQMMGAQRAPEPM